MNLFDENEPPEVTDVITKVNTWSGSLASSHTLSE